MEISVIIVNYKTPAMTLDAASSAIEQLQFETNGWNIVIVDNFSDDGSFELLSNSIQDKQLEGDSAWSNVSVISSSVNGGFGAGNNIGFNRFLNADNPPKYYYILNSDAFPEPDSIQKLKNYLEENESAGIAGSYIFGEDGNSHVTAFRFPTILGELEGSIRLGLISKLLHKYSVPMGIPDKTRTVDWLAGASMLIKHRVLDEVGLFDENYFLYFEETDLCFRAKKHGWSTVYVRDSKVKHIGSVSTGRNSWGRVPGYWLDSRRHFFIKNHGYPYYFLATITRIFGELVWRIRARIQRKETEDLHGFLNDLCRHTFSVYKPKYPI